MHSGASPGDLAPAELVDVVLAREQGFGTGAHPTTRHGDANGIDANFLTRDLLTLGRLEFRVVAMNVSELAVHLHLAADTEMPETEWLIVSGLDHPGVLAHAIASYEQAGFQERRRIDRDGWPAVLLRR